MYTAMPEDPLTPEGPLKTETYVFSKYYLSARCDVLTVVLLKIQVFRVVTPCCLVNNILGLLGPNDEDNGFGGLEVACWPLVP
jgi:hypothetical protein